MLISLIFTSCSLEREEPLCCINFSTGIAIKYLDPNGENLLDRENGIKVEDLSVFHRINGEWVEYFEGHLDFPKGIREVEGDDGTYLVVFASTKMDEENISETKLVFSEGDEDVIRSEIRTDNGMIVIKVWYNGELKWTAEDATERSFEVVKEL